MLWWARGQKEWGRREGHTTVGWSLTGGPGGHLGTPRTNVPVVQAVKNLPSMQKEMATHSSILAWRIPQTEEPGRLQSMGLQRVGHDQANKHNRAQTLADRLVTG